MVDNEVAGHDRVDPIRIATHPGHGIAHGGQVDHAGNPGEVLQDHPGRHEGDLALAGSFPGPFAEGGHVILGDHAPSGEPQGVLKEDPDGEGKPVQLGQSLALKLPEAENRGSLGP